MKTTIIQEIDPTEHEKDDEEKRNSLELRQHESPKNIENYLMLLKAFYENSFIPLTSSRAHPTTHQRSESFKENIFSNQNDDNNANSNQHKRDINISINNELDNSIIKESKAGNVGNASTTNNNTSLGNAIINSLDVSINVASKPSPLPVVRDLADNLHIISATLKTHDQQMVTSSSAGKEDEEKCSSMNNKWKLQQKNIVKEEKQTRLSEDEIDNDSDIRTTTARAAALDCRKIGRNGTSTPLPDDILFDYHNIVRSYHGNKFHCSNTAIVRPTPTTPNNHNHHHNVRQQQPSNRADDDVRDYREERCRSSEMRKSNKHSGDVKPITSTYLSMTRSMGLADEDALNMVSLAQLFACMLRNVFLTNKSFFGPHTFVFFSYVIFNQLWSSYPE